MQCVALAHESLKTCGCGLHGQAATYARHSILDPAIHALNQQVFPEMRIDMCFCKICSPVAMLSLGCANASNKR
jgi:hypothetical protein